MDNPMHRRRPPRAPARAYTLIEVLIVVSILGLAATLLIPSLSRTGILRVQAAVRTIVADVTFAQADALAYQDRRAVVFFPDENRYLLCDVNGTELDLDNDVLFHPDGPGQRYDVTLSDKLFGGAVIESADFDGDAVLVFDEMGGPVETLDGDTPGVGGEIVVNGSGQQFTISIEPYTGRVTVERTSDGEGGE